MRPAGARWALDLNVVCCLCSAIDAEASAARLVEQQKWPRACYRMVYVCARCAVRVTGTAVLRKDDDAGFVILAIPVYLDCDPTRLYD